jgi:hypothetical protein
LRGFTILILIAIPGVLLIHSLFSTSELPNARWMRAACPAQPPISLAHLLKYPERYRDRIVWIVGQAQIVDRICLTQITSDPTPLSAQKPSNLCHPCQARVAIQHGAYSILLDGWLPSENGLLQRIACRGNSCNLSCAPFEVGNLYAVAGQAHISPVSSEQQQFPRFKLRAFWLMRFCPLSNLSQIKHLPQIDDPMHRRPHKMQQSQQ